MSGLYMAIATGAGALLSYDQGKKAQKAAQRQHDQTMVAEAQAAEETKAYDLAAGQDIKDSESATTLYGGDRLKKKKLTANDLLVRNTTSSESSLGLGFEY